MLLTYFENDYFIKVCWQKSPRKWVLSPFPWKYGSYSPPNPSVQTFLCAGAAFVGNPDNLINYISIIGMTKTCITLTALIIIKLTKMPVAKGAIRVNFPPLYKKKWNIQLPIIFPITELLINICFIIIPFYQNLVRSAIGIGIFLIGCGEFSSFFFGLERDFQAPTTFSPTLNKNWRFSWRLTVCIF